MKASRLLLFPFILGVGNLVAADSYPSTPAGVVQAYCQSDGKGDGLSSEGTDRLFRYTVWDDGPGWDTAVVVSAFWVRSAKQAGSNAEVRVAYDVLGTASMGWKPQQQREDVTFKLKRTLGRWKISEPQLPPHVTRQTALEKKLVTHEEIKNTNASSQNKQRPDKSLMPTKHTQGDR